MPDDVSDWSVPELTRAVIALTQAVEALRQTIAELDEKFVLRAVHDVEMANLRQTQRTQGDVLDRIQETEIPGLHARINTVKDAAHTRIDTVQRAAVSKSTVWQVVGLVLGVATIAVAVLAIYHGSN